jgi:hypothetical protein
MRPVGWWTPWKPDTTAISRRSSKARRMPVPSMSRMRADPWASEARIGHLPALPGAGVEPHVLEHDGESPEVTCSPDATTVSYSRGS